ncbi:MAG: hypothetical protein KFF50_05235 [Desulfatitalea sp.]|nr:hypothetical protein [Desulfatitalea sp.]
MITVTVKLYGTLPQRMPAYDPQRGLVVTLGPGATVADLTRQLNLTAEDTGVVALDGRVAQPEDRLPNDAHIRIFQVALGG